MDKNNINTGLILNTENIKAYGVLNPNLFIPVEYECSNNTDWTNYQFINTYKVKNDIDSYYQFQLSKICIYL